MKYIKTFNESRRTINNSNIGLFTFDNTLTLYNPESDEVFAYIGLSEDMNGTFYFPTVAAKKGYGPSIYEFAMMYSGSGGLMISRDGDIRGDAFNIWQRFYDSSRRVIKKETLPIEDDRFNFAIVTGEEYDNYETITDKKIEFEGHKAYGDEKAILVYNTKMYMNKNKIYNRLITIADDWLVKKSIDIEDVENKGNDFFHIRYNYE